MDLAVFADGGLVAVGSAPLAPTLRARPVAVDLSRTEPHSHIALDYAVSVGGVRAVTAPEGPTQLSVRGQSGRRATPGSRRTIEGLTTARREVPRSGGTDGGHRSVGQDSECSPKDGCAGEVSREWTTYYAYIKTFTYLYRLYDIQKFQRNNLEDKVLSWTAYERRLNFNSLVFQSPAAATTPPFFLNPPPPPSRSSLRTAEALPYSHERRIIST
ncbi:hypothetical protein EVAR_92551_1 [Eumeta japonica]|uniref:Uncharacterized protein n=1 Tax=Eumeta variegata TaxID=151549 RepID=A0A4C1SWD2_EUMVA|nr:hypothetical protein EVAR_92551_1 [Eumeta japonica]